MHVCLDIKYDNRPEANRSIFFGVLVNQYVQSLVLPTLLVACVTREVKA